MSLLRKIKSFSYNIFYQFLDFIGWFKIILESISAIYGVIIAIDTTNLLTSKHPCAIFFHWIFLAHPTKILLVSIIIILIISIVEKLTIGSFTILKGKLQDSEKKLDIINNNIRELFEGLLMSFANAELHFGTDAQNQERISIYIAKNDEQNNSTYLFPLARYSSNPIYRNTRRKKYNINKGCIGKAYINDYEYNGYITKTVCKKLYSYSDQEYDEIRMKSKTIAAIAIKDKTNRILGVIVAESIAQNWLKDTIKDKLEKQAKYYAEIYIKFKDYIDDKVDNNMDKGEMPW